MKPKFNKELHEFMSNDENFNIHLVHNFETVREGKRNFVGFRRARKELLEDLGGDEKTLNFLTSYNWYTDETGKAGYVGMDKNGIQVWR